MYDITCSKEGCCGRACLGSYDPALVPETRIGLIKKDSTTCRGRAFPEAQQPLFCPFWVKGWRYSCQRKVKTESTSCRGQCLQGILTSQPMRLHPQPPRKASHPARRAGRRALEAGQGEAGGWHRVAPRWRASHRHADAARQCCATIPGYPVIAAKLERAMNATDIRPPGA